MAHYCHGRDITAESSFTPRVLSIVADRLRESDRPIGKVAKAYRAGITASDLMPDVSHENGVADRHLKAYKAAIGISEPGHPRVKTEAIKALTGVLETNLDWRAREQVQSRIEHLESTRQVSALRGLPRLDFEGFLPLLASGAALQGMYAHRDGAIRTSGTEALAARKFGRSLDLRSRLQSTDRSGSSSRRYPLIFERVLLAPADRRTEAFNKADESQFKTGLSNNEARTHAERDGNRHSVPARLRRRAPGTGTEIFRVTLNEIDFLADCMHYRIVEIPTDATNQRRLRDAARTGKRAAHPARRSPNAGSSDTAIPPGASRDNRHGPRSPRRRSLPPAPLLWPQSAAAVRRMRPHAGVSNMRATQLAPVDAVHRGHVGPVPTRLRRLCRRPPAA